jgi:uncharacterized membrane protein
MSTGQVADPTPAVSKAGRDEVPEAARLPFDAPWGWLEAGWRDLWSIPNVSLTYGAIFSVIAALLIGGLYAIGMQSLFLALAGGFLLIGPVAAMGLYEASRRLSQGKSVRLSDVSGAGKNSSGQLGFMGVIVLFMFMVWVQLAFLLLMLFMGGGGLPPPSEFMQALLFTPRGLGLLIIGTIVGGLIAMAVFAVTAVSVPMLLDRRVDAVTAARASIMAVLRNPKPMALWAALIVVLIGAGIATLLVGLVIAFPLIGHATWHAYRQTFPEE